MAALTTRPPFAKATRSLKLVQYRGSRSVSYESLQWLSHCKAEELKQIATAIGSNSSGTKADLTSNLQNDLSEDRLAPPEGIPEKYAQTTQHHIVSIDMGIRNLAFCRLALPPNWASITSPAVPVVYQWARIAISERANAENSTDGGSGQGTKEAFDPATYAQHAFNLITRLLSSQPTQILIERQRFRSMGGSAVQEWTLRVNMFESMLYAVLRTMSELGVWKGVVNPVGPAKVLRFWLGDAQDKTTMTSISKSAKTKAAKVNLVAKWLKDGSRFKLQGEADNLGQAFLKQKKGVGGYIEQNTELKHARSRPTKVKLGKLDDLADCLLQGMAWVQWEKNRRAIVAKGRQALEEL